MGEFFDVLNGDANALGFECSLELATKDDTGFIGIFYQASTGKAPGEWLSDGQLDRDEAITLLGIMGHTELTAPDAFKTMDLNTPKAETVAGILADYNLPRQIDVPFLSAPVTDIDIARGAAAFHLMDFDDVVRGVNTLDNVDFSEDGIRTMLRSELDDYLKTGEGQLQYPDGLTDQQKDAFINQSMQDPQTRAEFSVLRAVAEGWEQNVHDNCSNEIGKGVVHGGGATQSPGEPLDPFRKPDDASLGKPGIGGGGLY